MKKIVISSLIAVTLTLLVGLFFNRVNFSDSLIPKSYAELGGGENGIVVLSYEDAGYLVLVDTSSKKILHYEFRTSRGLVLKEIRSFAEPLTLPNYFGKGLTGKDEKIVFEKILNKKRK